MAAPHKYPTGRADFESIINEGFLYVDKTERMYEMIGDRKFVFLSRPRRFGKSLLVNTLQAYFEGKKDLFKGLKIYDLEKEWIQYPVISLDMSAVKDETIENMPKAIGLQIERYENKYSIPVEKDASNGARLNRLIDTAKAQTGRNVVVLIDEYDAPHNAHLHDGKLYDVKPIMQNVYQQLIVCEKNERFVFITGISKFSVLDNFDDLSMWDSFSDICGFTKCEIQHFVESQEEFDYICGKCGVYKFASFAQEMLSAGDVLELLSTKNISSKKIPDYILDYLKQGTSSIDLNQKQLFVEDFYCYLGNGRDFWPFMYQNGYVTIKNYDTHKKTFTIGSPK